MLRAAGIGVSADHLIVWDAAGTRHLIGWPSVAGFDLEKRWSRGGGYLTLIVICDDGRRLHASGCSFSGTGEESWAAGRQMVRALESERQARTPGPPDRSQLRADLGLSTASAVVHLMPGRPSSPGRE